jgi:hypothetical protein
MAKVVPPIRLRFGQVAVVPASASDTERATNALTRFLQEAVIDRILELKPDAASQRPAERFWAPKGSDAYVPLFPERNVSIDQLRSPGQDFDTLLGRPKPELDLACHLWRLCNGKKGADFRAYEIIRGVNGLGKTAFIYVNEGRPIK